MKQIIKSSLYLLLLLPLHLLGQLNLKKQIASVDDKNECLIVGNIKGLKDGDSVFAVISDSRSGFGPYSVVTDSVVVRNGRFQFNDYVPQGPRIYWFQFAGHNDIMGNPKSLRISVDNGEKVTINCDSSIDQIKHTQVQHFVAISGSPTNFSTMCLEPVHIQYFGSIGRINQELQKIPQMTDENKELVGGLIKAKQSINETYSILLFKPRVNIEPEYGPARLLLPTVFGDFNMSGHAAFWVGAYKNLTDEEKNTYYGKWLKEQISLCVGQPFPEFALPDIKGKVLDSKAILAKSKLTIVQFWSTTPIVLEDRIKFQKEFGPFLNKYYEKGLSVICVSSDSVLHLWQQVVKEEQLPWYNVIDKAGRLKESVYYKEGYTYHGENLDNVLVDGEGRIVAWGLRGAELQWYVAKAFGELPANTK